MSDIELLSQTGHENHQDLRSIEIGPISTIPGVQCVAIDTIPQLRRVPAESAHYPEIMQDLPARESAPLPEQFHEMRIWTNEALSAFKEKIVGMEKSEVLPLRAFESRIVLPRADFKNISAKMPYLEILTVPVSQMPDEFVQMLRDVVNGSYIKEIHFIAPDLKWYQFFSSYFNFLPKEQIKHFEAFALHCMKQSVDLSYAGKRIAWMTPSERALKYFLWFFFAVSWITFAVSAFGSIFYDSFEGSEVHTSDEHLQELKYKKVAFSIGVFSPIGVFLTIFMMACAEYYPKKVRYEKLDEIPFELPQITTETV